MPSIKIGMTLGGMKRVQADLSVILARTIYMDTLDSTRTEGLDVWQIVGNR